MSFFEDIGNFFGGLFGGNQQKKKQDQNQASTISVQQPTRLVPQQQNPYTPSLTGNLSLPSINPQQNQQQNQSLVLGGVQPNPADNLNRNDIQQAQNLIKAGGSGAPYAPEVINAANKGLANTPDFSQPPKPKPDPWYLQAAHGLIGAENTAGSLAGSLIGSLIPIGDANVYSNEGRQNLVRNLQNETYNPNTGQWFTTGKESVNKIQSDINTGNNEALAGDFLTTLLNGLSFVPADRAFTLGRDALTAQGASQVGKDIAVGGAVGGGYGAGMGTGQAFQQDASLPDVAKSAGESAILGAALGSLIPAATGGAGLLRNRIINRAANEGNQVIDSQVGNSVGDVVGRDVANQAADTAAITPRARDINPSLTPSTMPEKAPAITSANRPAPSVQQKLPIFTNPEPVRLAVKPLEGVAAPEAQPAPPVKAPASPTPDQLIAEAKQLVDAQSVKPEPAPAPTQVVPAESPKTTLSKAAATEITPVNPEAVNQAVKAQAEAQAPTDVTAQAAKTDNFTPEQQQSADAATATTNKILQVAQANGVDYGALAAKEAENARILREGNGTLQPLTPAEKKVAQEVTKAVNDARAKLQKAGVSNEDLGANIPHYIPTGKSGDLNRISSMNDVKSLDFGFAKRREGKLSPQEIAAGSPQALENYLRAGELAKHLTPADVQGIKLDRLRNQTTNFIESNQDGTSTGLHLTDQQIQELDQSNNKLLQAESNFKQAGENTVKGKLTPEKKQAVVEAQQQLLDAQIEQKANMLTALKEQVDTQIKDIKSSGLSLAEQQRQINAAQKIYYDKRLEVAYQQDYPTTNILSGLPGRAADQTAKAVQTIGDSITGVASKLAADSRFRKDVGRALYADRKTTKTVYKSIKNMPDFSPLKRNYKLNRAIDKANGKNSVLSIYKSAGTSLTELGSRYRAPLRDTVSYFAAKGKAEGINNSLKLTQYVREQVGSKEWNRVYDEHFNFRNQFTGVSKPLRGFEGETAPSSGTTNFSKFLTGVDKGIFTVVDKVTPGLSYGAKKAISGAVRKMVVGFPQVTVKATAKQLNNATAGLYYYFKAAKISGNDEAAALRRALYLNEAVKSTQTSAGVALLGAHLGRAGLISGAYPSDPAERRRWEAEGKQPYSLNVGGHWIPITRVFGAYGLGLLFSGELANGDLKPSDVPQFTADVVKGITQNQGLDEVGNLFTTLDKLVGGDPQGALGDLAKYVPSIIDSFIPASSFLNAAGKGNDPYQRDTSGNNVLDQGFNSLKAKLPIARETLPVKTDAFGIPLTQDNTAGVLPVQGGSSQDIQNNPVAAELHRLSQSGVEAYPNGVQGNSKNYTLKDTNGDKVSLTSDQQISLDNTVKQEKLKQAYLVMSSPEYQSANDKAKGEMLSKLYNLDSSATAAKWASDNGISNIKLSSDNVNNKLPAVYQQALVSYKLQGDKAKAWLDNNKNAADYYTAVYENAKLNGTLTAEDENLQHKSGMKYKAVEAQVNQQYGADKNLQQLYQQISASDFKKMIDPTSSEYDLATATKLYHYDEARAKAGVSDAKFTDKQKYSLNLSGSGSKRSKSFSFASIPSSLIGAGGTGNGSAGGYASNAPLFKPIADLKAPTGAPIPRGRTISVKKGIQI